MSSNLKPGSVVQITDKTLGRGGWLGAFVLVTEVKSWGVQGFVQFIIDSFQSGMATSYPCSRLFQ